MILLLLFLLFDPLLSAGMELNWKEVKGAQSYDLQIFSDSSCLNLDQEYEVPGPPFIGWNPPEEGTFSWRVRGKSSGLLGPFSRCGEIVAVRKLEKPSVLVETEPDDPLPDNLYAVLGLLHLSGGAENDSGQVPSSEYDGGFLNLKLEYRKSKRNSPWSFQTGFSYHQVHDKIQGFQEIPGSSYRFDVQSGWSFKTGEVKAGPCLGISWLSVPVSNSPAAASHLQASWFLPYVCAEVDAEDINSMWRFEIKAIVNSPGAPALKWLYHWKRGSWIHGPFWEWYNFKSSYKLETSQGQSLGEGELKWSQHFIGWSFGRTF